MFCWNKLQHNFLSKGKEKQINNEEQNIVGNKEKSSPTEHSSLMVHAICGQLFVIQSGNETINRFHYTIILIYISWDLQYKWN